MRNRLRVLLSAFLISIVFCGCSTMHATSGPDSRREMAESRIMEYMHEFNYAKEDPGRLWDMLCEEYRGRMTREDFIKAYLKDISYPYITPFYIFMPEFDFREDSEEMEVTFQQAARIIGMTWKVRMVYENGDYYFKDWDYLIDGSYMEKFDDLMYSLDWYYDF